ncbi:MAG: hypothetical protein PCFJNLEI_02004 [Verrucomicrobiae bacterium]|nr:hypothetical protein [Verrucomicrobiae bacterium]
MLGVAVVVGVAFAVDDVGAEAAEAFFKTFGYGDAGEGGDVEVLENFQVMTFAGKDVLDVEGVVGAFDDFGFVVELADGFAEFVRAELAGFGDEDVAGTFEVVDRFAEGAAGEEEMIAERVVAVNETDVEPAFEAEVLEPVVEEEGVAAEPGDGVAAGLYSVFVHEDDDVLEVGGEHVGFVAGLFAVEEEGLAVGDNFGWNFVFLKSDFGDDALPERAGDAFVAAGEDGNAAAGLLEGTGEDFYDRGFAGAADGEVTDADDLAAEGVVPEDAVAPEEMPELDDEFEEFGKGQKDAADKAGTEIVSASKDDVEDVLLDVFSPLPHGPA